MNKFEAEVAGLVNKERVKAGCTALSTDARLARAARAHSQDMATNNFFSHTSRQGRSSAQRVLDAGYNWQWTGENIAAGQRTPKEVMTAWMNSSGHRANIVNGAFRDLGIGVATRSNTTFWIQDIAPCAELGSRRQSTVVTYRPPTGDPSTDDAGPCSVAPDDRPRHQSRIARGGRRRTSALGRMILMVLPRFTTPVSVAVAPGAGR